jgi:hypothetical protein
VEGLQMGMALASTVGVGGVFFAAGRLFGHRGRSAKQERERNRIDRQNSGETADYGCSVEAPSPEISNNRARKRFEIRFDGHVVGFSEYVRRGSMIAFHHTEIDRPYQGRGLGQRLISFALDAARDEGLWVQAYCPFVHAFIEKHAEYEELLRPQRRTLDSREGVPAAGGQ